jgi:hypothetical protein
MDEETTARIAYENWLRSENTIYPRQLKTWDELTDAQRSWFRQSDNQGSLKHYFTGGDPMSYDPDRDARSAATNNITWAIAVILIIAAIAIAVVFVVHNVQVP